MKIIFLFIMLQVVVFNASAQKSNSVNLQRLEPVNTMRDKQEYQGYMIRLRPGNMRNYGFEILKDNKPVAHQFQNPLPFSARGIQNKEDAYKIAQWIIGEYIKTGHWQNMVPPHVLNRLKIKFN